MNTRLQTNPQLPSLGRELLRKVMDKEITLSEFHKECAYWMTGDLSSMYYKQDIEKPSLIQDYEDRRARDSSYSVSKEFWERPEIKAYTTESRKISSENKANWYWLHFMKKHIPLEDNINHSRIKGAIQTYPRAS